MTPPPQGRKERMMKVTARLNTYDDSAADHILVESHWNRNGSLGFVVLIIKGERFTVSAQYLKKAISSCTDLD